MAIALVGTAGASSQSTAGGDLTPSWDASENRTAGNLLICAFTQSTTGGSGIPTTPSGWSRTALGTGSADDGAVYYKVAAGSDAAPIFTHTGGTGKMAAQLLEFSGAAGTVDKSGVNVDVLSSPCAVNLSAADTQSGDLVIWSFNIVYTTAATKTFTDTLNNGQTGHVADNAGVSTIDHYHFVWAITTGNSAADQDSLAVTTTKLSTITGVGASFNPAAAAAAAAPIPDVNMAPYIASERS